MSGGGHELDLPDRGDGSSRGTAIRGFYGGEKNVGETPDAARTMDKSLAFVYGEEWVQGPDAMGAHCKNVQDHGGDGPAMEDTSAF